MAEETIFGKDADQDQDSVNNQDSNQDRLPTEVQELIGEGKKYATTDEALKALFHSQKHITTIESENAEMRGELNKLNSISDMLEAKQKEGSTDKNIDPASLNELIDQRLSDNKKQESMQSNIDSVDARMKTAFGAKAEETMLAKAAELGMTVKQMMNTAANSPTAFMSWFDLTKGGTQEGSMNSDVNTEQGSFNPSNEDVKPFTYKHYEKIRKASPAQYMSPKIQAEMNQKMIEMGESFWT